MQTTPSQKSLEERLQQVNRKEGLYALSATLLMTTGTALIAAYFGGQFAKRAYMLYAGIPSLASGLAICLLYARNFDLGKRLKSKLQEQQRAEAKSTGKETGEPSAPEEKAGQPDLY